MFEPVFLVAVAGLITAVLGVITERVFASRLMSETVRASEQAEEIAAAISAQAEASKARALEVLAKRAPPGWTAADLLRAVEMLEVPPADRLISERKQREEERQTWTLVEDLVNSYHRQALDQARVQFWFSIVAAVVGFGWILFSATSIDPTQLVTVSKTLPGLAIDAVAALFFRQAGETRQRATALYDRLRADNQRSQAVTLVESIEDQRVRSAVQAQLSLHMAGLQPSPIDLSAFLSRPTDEEVQSLLRRARGWRPAWATPEGRKEGEEEILSE